MKNRLLLAAFLLISSPTLVTAEELFDIKPVAEGVYAAIAKRQYRANSNSAIILLDDSVLVVDAQSKPSAARALIADIKKLTDKPVKYVVFTHEHGDHIQGIEAFLEAWPAGVEIISSEAAREGIERRGIARAGAELNALPHRIDTLQGDLGKASDPREKEQIQEKIRQAEAYQAELKVLHVILPNLTLNRSLILRSKSREVDILWLGRAHTDGDVFVYMPKERVLVTGDVLDSMVPVVGDGYMYDWIRTLDEAEKLDFVYVIGGHGDILHGKETFELWKEYFSDLMAETAKAYGQDGTLEEVQRRVAPILEAKYAGKFPTTFPQLLPQNIEKAYRSIVRVPPAGSL